MAPIRTQASAPLSTMKPILGLALSLALAGFGCTTVMVQKQAKPRADDHHMCPDVYPLTRMEIASLAWAFSDDLSPDDPCLARYYPKAAKDPFYASSNRYMMPLYILSLPVDVMVDTVTLPFAAAF